MFGAEDIVKVADVIDGTSNTTLFGDMSRFRNEAPSTFNFWYFTAAFSSNDYPAPVPQTGAFTLPRINSPPDITGNVTNSIWPGCGSSNGIPTDWLINCPQALTLGNWAFRSNHPGGVNMAFADGSVKFIKQTIADRTWQSIGTRAGARSSAPTSSEPRPDAPGRSTAPGSSLPHSGRPASTLAPPPGALMSIRTALIGSSLLAALVVGCSESTPTLAPVDEPANAPKKTATGVQIKKHAVPVAPNVDAVTP